MVGGGHSHLYVGATHYPLIRTGAQMFVEGRPLPPVTMAMVDELEPPTCRSRCAAPPPTFENLWRDGDKALADPAMLDDADLERVGFFLPFATNEAPAKFFQRGSGSTTRYNISSMRATVIGMRHFQTITYAIVTATAHESR